MKKIWVKKLNSFKEANKFDQDYYLKMSTKERLETIQFLREEFFKIKGKDASRKGLRRIFKVVQ